MWFSEDENRADALLVDKVMLLNSVSDEKQTAQVHASWKHAHRSQP
jgi:hypothetical protein